MKNKELKLEIIKEYINALDSESKWFKDDVKSFKERLKSETDSSKLKAQLGNIRSLNGKNKAFNAKIKKISKELDMNGMFDIGKMKPKNALD